MFLDQNLSKTNVFAPKPKQNQYFWIKTLTKSIYLAQNQSKTNVFDQTLSKTNIFGTKQKQNQCFRTKT